MQIAFYKAKGTVFNELIRRITHGPYSHCELVIQGRCYSSSALDGGVRSKLIEYTDTAKWDLVDVPWADEEKALAYFVKTEGAGYSYSQLVLNQLFNLNVASNGADFCSSWCARALGVPSPSVYNPNTLRDLLVFLADARTK